MREGKLERHLREEPITFSEAINEALYQCMLCYPEVVLMGQLVDSKPGIFGTTTGLVGDFPNRVFDFPVAEGLMHAAGIGIALTGHYPVICHQRMDFMAPGLDALINWLGLWYFKTGGQTAPLTIRAIVGKGWGQAPQHSKNLTALLASLPGINIYCPSNPHDAKGMLIKAITSHAPAIIVEHRSLFDSSQQVPTEMYASRQCPRRLLEGNHVTVVAMGDMVPQALKVLDCDEYKGYVDLFDLRMVKPLGGEGFQAIKESALCTGKLVVLEPGWADFGIGGEILSQVMDDENGFETLMAYKRVGYPQCYTPMSRENENDYYPSAKDIKLAVEGIM